MGIMAKQTKARIGIHGMEENHTSGNDIHVTVIHRHLDGAIILYTYDTYGGFYTATLFGGYFIQSYLCHRTSGCK